MEEEGHNCGVSALLDQARWVELATSYPMFPVLFSVIFCLFGLFSPVVIMVNSYLEYTLLL